LEASRNFFQLGAVISFVMRIFPLGIRKFAFATLLALYFMATGALTARAGLGGDAASIESDAAAMHGTMVPASPLLELAQPSSFNVTSFSTDDGITVHEYATLSGRVFAVSWQGRRPPDMKVMLGSYYPEYSAAAAAKRHTNLHHAVIAGPNSTVVLGGHMGFLTGRAYVPGLAPSGVDAKAVVK
jgi:hypothetical protein